MGYDKRNYKSSQVCRLPTAEILYEYGTTDPVLVPGTISRG